MIGESFIPEPNDFAALLASNGDSFLCENSLRQKISKQTCLIATLWQKGVDYFLGFTAIEPPGTQIRHAPSRSLGRPPHELISLVEVEARGEFIVDRGQIESEDGGDALHPCRDLRKATVLEALAEEF